MTVQEVLEQAKALDLGERKELIKLLVDTFDALPISKPLVRRSILELAGLGAEVWDGIDPQEYVDQLRSEWDHRP
ncbi:MAG: hypothetical protein H7Z42_22055 [Roseiflexaceae bacterium]|nr:hypothetical protein [Roseiflexaceae bacterium]